MKVVTLYTDSHKEMLDKYFLPSFPVDPRLELKTVYAPPMKGEKPVFNSPEWREFMKVKSRLLEDELLSIPENDIYVFLDCDIIIVQNFHDFVLREMEGLDFATQSDSNHPQIPNYCTGVCFFRNTQNTRFLLKAVNLFMDTKPQFNQEQEVFTHLVAFHRRYHELQNLKGKLLSFDNSFSLAAFGNVWDNNPNFPIPSKENLMFLHANYAQHDQKIPLLKVFKQKL